MNKEMLENAVNGINDKYIVEAQTNLKGVKKMNKKKLLIAAAVCAVLMSVLTVFGAAKVKQYIAFSPEHIEHLKQEAQKAQQAGENDAEIAAIKAAVGGFSDLYDVVIEDEPYIEINETVKNGGYIFELQNIRKGKAVRMRGNGVSPASDAYEMHEQVEEGLFAVVKITSENGADMEAAGDSLMAGAVISGQQPWWSLNCMYNFVCNYYEDGAYYIAYDLSNGLIFADRDIYLALFDAVTTYCPGTENKYMLESTKDGIVSFSPEYTYPHALFKLKLDASFADKQAQKDFISTYRGIEIK
ncbi:MAG: hypothetical protein MJ177_03265 [Clostridia bacterium]|nr:hypothetical protein [Clostridia bacterium]